MREEVCPEHGPYNAALGACPVCHGQRPMGRLPAHPLPLDDDELPTDPGVSRGPGRARDDDDDAPTQFPRAAAGGRRATFNDDDEPTEMPRRRPGVREEDELDHTEIERPQTGLIGWLVVKSGGRYGHMYKIKPGAVLGRDRNKADMLLDDSKVSSLHAKFTVKDGRFVLWDLGSSNGTYVNGQAIDAATPVAENDEIKVGNLIFVLKTLGETRQPG